jgi:hypothetical protein
LKVHYEDKQKVWEDMEDDSWQFDDSPNGDHLACENSVGGHAALITQVEQFMREQKVPQTNLAKQVGCSKAQMNAWLQGQQSEEVQGLYDTLLLVFLAEFDAFLNNCDVTSRRVEEVPMVVGNQPVEEGATIASNAEEIIVTDAGAEAEEAVAPVQEGRSGVKRKADDACRTDSCPHCGKGKQEFTSNNAYSSHKSRCKKRHSKAVHIAVGEPRGGECRICHRPLKSSTATVHGGCKRNLSN